MIEAEAQRIQGHGEEEKFYSKIHEIRRIDPRPSRFVVSSGFRNGA
jgi:hypothetical protein